jgi:CubicO group peptidase (beta-lactamase class C family)
LLVQFLVLPAKAFAFLEILTIMSILTVSILSNLLTNSIMKNLRQTLILAVIFASVISCTHPSGLSPAKPESVGISAVRLDRIDTLVASAIDSGWITGGVGFVARDGKIAYCKSFGYMDPESKSPMKNDNIFRIASQTKAITSLAAMILFEEGKLLLDDPLSKYIPEFAHPVVLDKFNPADTTYTTIPASREISIRDLLTHTSGIDYPKIGSDNMKAIYEKNNIPVGFESRPMLLDESIKKLGKLPLVHQPGLQFTYGLNSDVLGYLVEVVSGMSLDKFMQERIFKPLDMKDTYFYIPAEKQDRLVKLCTENESHKAIKLNDNAFGDVNINYPLSRGTYFSGGAGLSSTILDYAKFLQMMLNGGEYNGNRIISRKTVELMTSNQIGDLNLGENKFGLGFEITTERGQSRLGVSSGSFAWGGIYGTTYWADPKEKLVCLLFFQQWPLSHGDITDKFRVLVYSALE